MTRKTILSLVLSSVLITGCNGGGEQPNTSVSKPAEASQKPVTLPGNEKVKTISGVAIDGYLNNAKVCLDINHNLICDDGDGEHTFTDKKGRYLLAHSEDSLTSYEVIVEAIPGQTIDMDDPDSEIEHGFILISPALDHAVVSPVSTVTHLLSQQGSITLTESQSYLSKVINIPRSYLTKDYIGSNLQQDKKLHAFAKGLTYVLQQAERRSEDDGVDVLNIRKGVLAKLTTVDLSDLKRVTDSYIDDFNTLSPTLKNNLSKFVDSLKVTKKETENNLLDILYPAPKGAVVNDISDTFDWDWVGSFTAFRFYEISTDAGRTWQNVTEKPFKVGDNQYDVGDIQVRLKQLKRYATKPGDELKNSVPFTLKPLDDDNDGVPNELDDFPNDIAASIDSDGDRYPDSWNQGKDQSDSNGLLLDLFPNDPLEWLDTDKDGIGDNSDADMLPDEGIEKVFIDYFDIAVGVHAGEPVIGTIQLADNHKATFGDANFNDYAFAIAGSNDNGKFELENIYDNGRLHGQLKVAANQVINSTDGTTLRVELKKNDALVSRFNVTINVEAKTQWKTYFERLIEFAKSESRMWGKRNSYYGNERPKPGIYSVEEVLTEIESNSGKFTDLGIYHIKSFDELLSKPQTDNINQFEEAAKRIGGLGFALSELDKKNDDQYVIKRKRLISGIVTAFNAYAKLVPVKEFDDFGADQMLGGFSYNDRTHQWRLFDPVSLPLILAFEDTWKKAQTGDEQANQFIKNVYRLYQIAFSLPYQERFDRSVRPLHLYTRSFLEKDVSQSPGVWNDANRHHRMRAWATMVGVWKDYNRPLTDKAWWYSDYTPFDTPFNTDSGLTYSDPKATIFPEWQPKGSFHDLKVWVDTNTRYGFTVGNSGLLPDGTISHHTGKRQDLALFAYGYEWMSTTPMKVAALLKGTKWQPSSETVDNSAEFILKTMAPVIYKDNHDYQASGRSFLSSKTKGFGSQKMAGDIDTILSSKAQTAELQFEDELLSLKQDLLQQRHSISGSFPYWNSEFLVHRRAGETPWYASWRSQSRRVRGAESFAKQPGFHNGSGILQVKVDGDEYEESRFDWDWHLQPGLTEEWRTDVIPMQSEDTERGLSKELVAGVLSDNWNSVASFKYSTKASYASARADKSAFFSDLGVVAIGENIKRDKKYGAYASAETQPIVTTIDQAKLDSDISYDLGDGFNTVSGDTRKELIIHKPVWFHQGKKGYLVWPDQDSESKLILVTGNQLNDTYTKESKGVSSYALVIDHGIEPTNNSNDYQYLIIPNVTAEQMPALLEKYKDSVNLERIMEDGIYGVRWLIDGKQLIQLAFHHSGHVSLANGVEIRADKPALVMLSEQEDNTWKVAVSSPTHRSAKGDPDKRTHFRVYLRPGENIVNVTTNLNLEPGHYEYKSLGYIKKYYENQNMDVYRDGSNSIISVNLPDFTDDKIYGLREELFSGMSAVVSVPKASNY